MPSADLVYNFLGLDRGAGASFDRMAGKTLGLGRASSTAEKAINRLVLGAGAAATVIGVESVKAAANYQTALTQLVTGAGETSKGLKTVHDQLLKMSGPMAETATDMAKAMYPIESAGFHAANGVRILRASIQGAKADGAQITTVADAVTTALKSYSLSSRNATKVTDAMVAAVGEGKTRMEDLAASLGNVLPSAAALNIPLQQVLGAMATMTSQGTDAAKASQYLRFAMASLANPTSKAQKELAALGLTSQQLADATAQKGLTGAFNLLEDAVGNKFPRGSAQYLAALSNIVGGTRGMQAALELTGKHLQTFQDNTNRVSDAMGHAGKNVEGWGTYTKTFQYNLDSAKGALHSLEIQLGEKLLPTATHALNWLATNGVSDLKSFGQWIEHNKGLLEALGGALGVTFVGLKGINLGRSIAGALGHSRSVLGGGIGAPIPVYVTNWQGGGGGTFGGGGIPGEKASGGLGRLGRFGLGAVSTVAAAAATTNVIKNQLALHDKSLTDRILNGVGSAMLFGSTSGELRNTKILPPVPADMVTNLTNAEKHLKSLGVVGVQFVETQKQSADAAQKNVQQLKALNQLLVVNPGLTAAAAKAHDRLATSMKSVVGQAEVEAALLGHDLGAGLVQGLEASIPHASAAGAAMVQSTLKQMRLAAQVNSPSKATIYIGQMLAEGLGLGFHATVAQVSHTISHDLQTLLDRMQNAVQVARTKLQGDLQARSQFVTQEMSSAALTNVPTVASGYTGNTTRLTSIPAFFKGQARDYARFSRELRRLAHLGLSKSLVSQIAAMGPTQGLQYAQQILANPSMIGSLDAYQKKILRSSRQIAGQQYDPQIRADRRNLHRQTELLQEIRNDIRQIARHGGSGPITLTINGRTEKLTQHEVQELLTAIERYQRRMGKG